MSAQANKPLVLIVDDMPANIRLLADCLREDYAIRVATGGAEALALAGRARPDIILLDVVMPDLDGYEVCRRLKADPKTAEIPVIFVTANQAPEDEAHGLSLGAVDYVVKPVSPAVARARVKNHLELRAAREALARQNEALKEAARLREDVDGIMRHDLKAPLTGIIGLPQIILDEGGLSESQAMFLRLIEENGYKMLSMINLSLDLFKIERGAYRLSPEPVELLAMARRLFVEFAALAGPRKLTCLLTVAGRAARPEDTAYLCGERLLLYSMLANCVKNALEASPPGGRVTVDVAPGEPTVLRVVNRGVVPACLRERFFTKYATEGKSGGTGLGAYSTRLIAETHGGSARMETSDEADCTVVTLTLPRGNLTVVGDTPAGAPVMVCPAL
ncbi:MAG: response regulator (CheY-like receiver domain and HD-GYP domain containing protein) [Solidesulfovibrio magneticus str. Maddingley MBC34]|uniref:histidine kinase n=1 Tax=Solidesulfovibrio magneticus str. Maddingley MBC34 TaxID=1206767 RepID=K6H5Y3_9BACT|nr:MAG: response regulator (CheY-like receiver domain and HD-GYP domain containing protein) [Solidesulfovibrio magneticus str. Maddingley MBC34]